MRAAFVIIIAYLLGSVPFGYLIVRASQGADVRETGSGGTGATNVSRRAGKVAGVVTLVLDAMKGATAVLIALWAFGLLSNGGQVDSFRQGNYWWVAGAAVAAILGHMFPVWLGFRGGKGVATAVGVFLVLAPIAVALAGVIFLLVVISTRYVSLASIVGAVAIPILVLAQDEFFRPIPGLAQTIVAAGAGAVLIIFAHRGNIGRLVEGTESRFR